MSTQPFASPTTPFQWDRPTGLITIAAAALCLVPALGFLLAWHMQLELPAFTRWAVLPALALLGLCEFALACKSPLLFNRFSSGLVGGALASLLMAAVRVPLATLVKGMPDYVPLIGQNLVGEPIGIAPSLKALLLGYSYETLLIGALLGAAYALLVGKGRWQFGLAAGAIAGIAFTCLPQFQLLSVAEGFSLPLASAAAFATFCLGGTVLGAVVATLGRTTTNALRVVFLRHEPVEALRSR